MRCIYKRLLVNHVYHQRWFYSTINHSSNNNLPEKRNETIRETSRTGILSETELSRNHLTPELQLHLITPNCRLWKAPPEDSPFFEPFWAFYWPGGQALSRYILDNKNYIKGKAVLDFGCGCGASGLASKLSGAKRVTYNDIDSVACEVVVENAQNNNIKVDSISTTNLIGTLCEEFDLFLVGDMLYDTEFADEVLGWLKGIHERGKTVLIGDPGRFALESHPLRSKLRCLAKYELQESTILENNGHPQAFVWTFR